VKVLMDAKAMVVARTELTIPQRPISVVAAVFCPVSDDERLTDLPPRGTPETPETRDPASARPLRVVRRVEPIGFRRGARRNDEGVAREKKMLESVQTPCRTIPVLWRSGRRFAVWQT
jgi:hypothetical protein